ncbi:hypothetical protein PRZ48_013926 [Zasmidium cellare]|uniref:Bifunctional cytochrome P450/NADPH--P450 reductase n=1 Tax=Zasmidium cellare TaxID=395010 RepID=A0ABR0DZK2_ZASCE|nr:hypothetical protein PRZ48_013926 [Zasmidium cellare]
MSSTIPGPRGYPIVGNLFDIDPAASIKSLDDLADKYGEIYKMRFLGSEYYFISSVDLVEEVCDETRFGKTIDDNLQEVRNGVHDGLFTAHNDEPNWGIAHRTLMPAFGPISIKNMFDEMHDIASQLVSKWARQGPNTPIHLTNDTTRLAFDTVTLCAAGMRLNSFYSEQMHPFIQAMGDFLTESGARTGRTAIEKVLRPGLEKKYRADIDLLRSMARGCIDNRKANPTDKKDLLNAMLYGKDPKAGQQLTEECNPEALQRAQHEVDTIVGNGPIKFQHMSKLPYIEAALRESIRLSPPVPSISVAPRDTKEPVMLKGKYVVPADATIYCLLTKSQRDPAVFGEDAAEFKPERMLDDKFKNMRNGAWKPFGNGARDCIGRAFAWQESILIMAMILQNFNLRFADPGYQLGIHETGTQKPGGFHIKASLRAGVDSLKLPQKLHAGAPLEGAVASPEAPVGPGHGSSTTAGEGKPITILYGSSAGTCEGLSHSLGSAAQGRGFKPEIMALDAAVDAFPMDHPVVIIASSYEGLPPENAKIFMEWLKTTKTDFSKARFTMFGVGHRDWVSTYLQVPRTIKEVLVSKGASVFATPGETDVSQGVIFDDFDAWMDVLAEKLSVGTDDNDDSTMSASFNVQVSTNARSGHLRYNHMHNAKVISNERFSGADAPEKRHLVLQLPTAMRYEAGDYLAVLPVNHTTTISRVLRRFSMPWDAAMTITGGTHATVPANTELSVAAVLASYVELSMPATRKNKEILAKCTEKGLTDDSGSVIDILERHPEIKLPLATFLAMLPALRLRQYSISSSPLADPSTASITFSVLESGKHLGAATNYLKELEPGSTIQIAIKQCSNAFRLPLDDNIPIIMACAGSGVAPFRGFVQQRAAKKASGKDVGEAILFVGCRSESDKVFADEFADWEAQGVVKVFHAYSRQSELTKGCKYVQDRLWSERELVSRLFDQQGARAYVCGSSKIGQGISDAVAKIVCEHGEKDCEPISYEEALKWWQDLRGDRYAVDVFD